MATSRPPLISKSDLTQMFAAPEQANRFPPLLTVRQAADLLQIPVSTIYEWSSRGKLKGCSKKVGKHLRICFHVHFTPTSSSWFNLIERWFRDITEKRIRRGVFRSVPELVQAIEDYIEHHNNHGKGFTWTAKAEKIIETVVRARAALDKNASE